MSRATSSARERVAKMAFFSPGGMRLSVDPPGVVHISSLSNEDMGDVRDVMELEGEGEGDRNEDSVVALEVSSG